MACLAQASKSGASLALVSFACCAARSLEKASRMPRIISSWRCDSRSPAFTYLRNAVGQTLAVQEIEHSVHGAERLSEVVHDAVEQNFLLLDFLQQLFVRQQGIARGLKPLLLLRECFGTDFANQQDLSCRRASERQLPAEFHGSILAAFDPIAGIGRTRRPQSPEFLSIHQKILQKRGLVPQTNEPRRSLRGAPQISWHQPGPTPSKRKSPAPRCSNSAYPWLAMKDSRIEFVDIYFASIACARFRKTFSTASPVFALVCGSSSPLRPVRVPVPARFPTG